MIVAQGQRGTSDTLGKDIRKNILLSPSDGERD